MTPVKVASTAACVTGGTTSPTGGPSFGGGVSGVYATDATCPLTRAMSGATRAVSSVSRSPSSNGLSTGSGLRGGSTLGGSGRGPRFATFVTYAVSAGDFVSNGETGYGCGRPTSTSVFVGQNGSPFGVTC